MNQELISKITKCKSVEELLQLAKEAGIDIGKDKAKELFDKIEENGGELPDELLDAISGGVWDRFTGGPRKLPVLD